MASSLQASWAVAAAAAVLWGLSVEQHSTVQMRLPQVDNRWYSLRDLASSSRLFSDWGSSGIGSPLEVYWHTVRRSSLWIHAASWTGSPSVAARPGCYSWQASLVAVANADWHCCWRLAVCVAVVVVVVAADGVDGGGADGGCFDDGGGGSAVGAVVG